MKIKRILCALALFVSAASASAQPASGDPRMALNPESLTEAQIANTQVPGALYRLAAMYKQNGDAERLVWVLKRLTVLQPNSGDLKFALASAYADQGKKTETYDTLLAMQKQGYGYDLASNPAFAKVADTRVWTYIVDGLKSNLKPFGEGKVAFTLPKGDTLFDSIAFDPQRKQFLIGSVREGKIYRAGKDGKLEEFIAPNAQNGLWSVYALAVDAANDALYVASTASLYFKGFSQADYGKAGVFKFKLSTGKLIDKYLLLPDAKPQTLSSIAVGKGGLVFAADGLRNVIYRLDGGALKPMVENPGLVSLRGMTLSDDGKTLYFADYVMGVFGVDLAAGKAFDLEYDPAKLVLGGIDGLNWYDHTLIAIENGMSPHRVMRISLDASGRKVVKAMPLDAANTALALPTFGAIDGDAIYFIANSQKNEYDSYGSPKDADKLEAVQVFRSNLRFAWDEKGIEMPQPKVAADAKPPLSTSKPGEGKFKNVDGGSQSVTGN